MAAAIEIVIYIFVFGIIWKRLKGRNANAKDHSHRVSGSPLYQSDIKGERTVVSNTTAGGYQKKQGTVQRTAQASVVTAVAKEEGESSSTTDYLAQKARMDQLEHAKEKQEESQRLIKKAGGLQPAERLFEGDPVPMGKHCVVCGYCAAHNLIPDGSRLKYSCYFCREAL